MSVNGLTQQYIPPTLDGLNVVEADQIYIDGELVNLDNLVPYTGATRTVDVGIFPIKTSYLAAANEDVVNKERLDLTVNNIVASIGANFLSKTNPADQTVASKVSFSSDLIVADEKVANLASKVVVDANYRNLITSASVSVGQNFGTITNALGVYQSTTDIASGIPILIAFPITSGKRYSFTIEMLVEDPTYTWYVDFYQSVDNINPVTGGVIGNFIFPQGSTSYTLSGYTFQALTTGNVIIPVSNDAPSPSNQAVKWKNLTVYEEGVALTNVSMPSQLADRVVVLNEKKQLVSSGINTTKLGYLDNVSSDIQTQLNSKANTSDLANYLPLTGGTLSGALTVNAALTVGNRFLGTPDNIPSGNFWMGLQGSGSETQRLALSFVGSSTTGEVSEVLISKPLNLDTNKITTSYVPVNGVDLTNKTYVDGAITGAGALYVLKAGDTMTGNLTLSGTGTTAGVLAKRFYLAARGDNQDDVAGAKVYGPWYGLGDSGITGFIGKPCLTGYYGCALRSGLGYMVVAENGNVGIGTTDPKTQLSIARDIAYADRASNPFKAQTTIKSLTNGQRLYLGAYYTGGEGSCSVIQSSDFYSELDHGAHLLINPLGGNVGIGTDPSAPLHIKSSGGSNPSTNGLYVYNTDNTAGQDSIVSIRVGGSSAGDAYTSYDIANEYGWTTGLRNSDNSYIISKGWSSLGDPHTYFYNYGIVDIKGGSGGVWGKDYAKNAGTLIIGRTDTNYGGQVGLATANAAGLLMECADHTEIQIHDSGARLASWMYYYSNKFYVGRDSGWGTTETEFRGTTNVYSAGANSSGGATFYVNNQGSGNSFAVMYLSSLGANCYWFLNSQDRSADGGPRTATIRNDNGSLRLQSSGGNGFTIDENSGYTRKYGGDNSKILYGPNASWGAYLVVGAGPNEVGSSKAQIISTNGNLHIDAGYSNDIYLGLYPNIAGNPNNIRLYGTTTFIDTANLYRGPNPSTLYSVQTNNTENRLMLRDYDGFVRHGQVATFNYANNNIAWVGGYYVSSAFYKRRYATVVFNWSGSCYSNSGGPAVIYIRVINQATGKIAQEWGYRFWHNLTGVHTSFTVPLVFAFDEADGWYDIQGWASGGNVWSDGNDNLWWNVLVIG